ncbi:MAG: OmpA family protein [Calditrichaceae bacterium]|nr:OmpA family protein [Calditrichaceae bacterium]MBN2709014.1 OmpA family protein [Calditrichaceae bacterium]RQV95334.1 MAG: OmpA family protein [Calditrichota bacterium]
MRITNQFVFIIFVIFSFTLLSAKDIPKHPVIKTFPGSVLAENMSKYQNFNEYEFSLMNKKTNKKENIKVKGKFWSLLWEVRTPSGDRVKDISKVEFFNNYKNAVAEAGGEILFEDALYLHFRIPKEDGGYSWCKLHTVPNLGQIYMVIVDEKGFTQSLIFGADKLKEEIDKSGKVLLYGILFDLDKSTLKHESEKQLTHIVSLMHKYPDLKIEIQGHTDSQGKADYNMKLSQERAETVKSYLKLFGIQENRLTAKGFGQTNPVTSNDTEEGKAKNRRVELVKK